MKRALPVLAVVIFLSVLGATGAAAQTFGGTTRQGTCVCGEEAATGSGFCVDGTVLCGGLAACTTTADCAAGEICGVNSCCPQMPGVCIPATAICNEMCAGAPGSCAGGFDLCVPLAPTLGQWGLAALAALLAIGAFVVLRARFRFGAPMAFLLLVAALALGTYSYGDIRDTVSSCEPPAQPALMTTFLSGG